ncbi:MAG: hypothetical protein AB9869_16655 [Verrucomicrobiia bacterium]
MPVEIRTVVDHQRGCGWRKPGLYLVADAPAAYCGKLPHPLTRCPCCDAGIKPTRGFTWINARMLLEGVECKALRYSTLACQSCSLTHPPEKAGLIWVGESR